jgi:uroporphyrin-III C-methyltransferase
MIKSRISFVGAGTGDAALITLKAIKAIENADAILYDSLVNPELLSYAKATCVRTFVGKRKGMATYSQEDINTLIVENAFEYGHVVRLKGGDPFVFGRATEELAQAKAFGIDYEVISGVSSCIAVPAAAGIPVTARGVADSFWVLTGTTQTGELSKDIRLAAQSEATIVVLMGLSKLGEICQIFSKAGKGNTSAAVIQDGTLPSQKQVIATVNTLEAAALESQIRSPAVIVIGEVVRLGHTKNLSDCLRNDQIFA